MPIMASPKRKESILQGNDNVIGFDEIIAKIQASIPGADVEIIDLTGTGDHLEAHIVSKAFEGKSLVERHRMVYEALQEELKGPIHALALKTTTPNP